MDDLQTYDSPLGRITLVSDGEALTALYFDGQKHAEAFRPERFEEKSLPVFDAAKEWLDRYFSGKAPEFTPPLRMYATPFRKAVWETLLTIPYGETVSYGQIAARLAAERGLARVSARAVGGAVGRNPLLLIVPCHRVVGADGSLTGYSAGLDRKRSLLALEAGSAEKKEQCQSYVNQSFNFVYSFSKPTEIEVGLLVEKRRAL